MIHQSHRYFLFLEGVNALVNREPAMVRLVHAAYSKIGIDSTGPEGDSRCDKSRMGIYSAMARYVVT
jgi:hypothetical protein